jgi:hypothetical protein
MRSQSQFCVRSVLNGYPTLAPAPGGPNKRFVNRLKQPGIENNRQRISQIEAIIADFDKTANELDGYRPSRIGPGFMTQLTSLIRHLQRR